MRGNRQEKGHKEQRPINHFWIFQDSILYPATRSRDFAPRETLPRSISLLQRTHRYENLTGACPPRWIRRLQMSGQENTPSTPAPATITIVGKLPKLSSSNLARTAAFLVQGNNVLTQTPVTSNGFRIRLSESIAIDPCVFVVLGPKGLDEQTLLARTDLPRLPLSSASKREARSGGVVTLDFASLNVDDKLIDAWWIWCRTYTVTGTVQTPNGCPVPAAEVTVYNVTSGPSGLVETPIETVQTNAEGQFTATFNWCECLCCWPCWPIWWRCWPWWWELDILAAVENIERQLASSPAQGVTAPVS